MEWKMGIHYILYMEFIMLFIFIILYLNSEQKKVDKYLRAEFVDPPSDPAKFWSKNEKTFPRLSKLAHKILSIPASTAENERMFSKLRLTITENRENIAPKTISSLLIEKYLRSNEIMSDFFMNVLISIMLFVYFHATINNMSTIL
jgi:hypothetical protein